jgi:geranylgeranyl pyrophosphate synthase
MKLMTAPFIDLVRGELKLVEEDIRARIGKHHPNFGVAIEQLLSSGGKRVRPTLTLLTGRMLGAEVESTVKLAAAIEMLHTATLVHDDLIDGSMLRRGLPTLNAQWTPGATVLTGDYMFARAADLAAQTGSLFIMRRFAETLMTIVNGEITQLFNDQGEDLRQDYFDRIYAKTASLFEVATQGAAVLGNAGEALIEDMKQFGYNIGLAFQIVDDVLDIVGQEERVGKPIGSDLQQGLITLPTLHYLENHPDNQDLKEVLNNGHIDEAGLARLVEAIRSSDAIERSLTEARQFVDSAIAHLAQLPASPERNALQDLAQFMTQRSV